MTPRDDRFRPKPTTPDGRFAPTFGGDPPLAATPLIENIFRGLKAYFQSILPGVKVQLAFVDERVDATDQERANTRRTYPMATLSLYDTRVGYSRRYGGVTRIVGPHQTNPDTMRSVTEPPTPIDLFFQLDTYATKRLDDWRMMEAIIVNLSRHGKLTKIAIPNSTPVHLAPVTYQTLDELAGVAKFRKAYRYRVEVWYESAVAAGEAYMVLTRHLVGNNEHYAMQS